MKRSKLLLALITPLLTSAPSLLLADTLSAALARAYSANPQLNMERAGVRAGVEDVARAAAGFRPKVNAEGFAGLGSKRYSVPGQSSPMESQRLRSGYLTVEQPLFDGNRTRNSVRSAEGNVLANRERLRLMEQSILLSVVTAYMNVLRDMAAYNLQTNNLRVLEVQLQQNRERLNEGQITPTDVAQSEARLASGRSQVSLARANLQTSQGEYRQVVGIEPTRLAPAQPVDRLLPKSLQEADYLAQQEHPAIAAALHGADVARHEVAAAEGEHYPTISLLGSVGGRADTEAPGERQTEASIVAKLSVPIYSGGATSARIQQVKELAAQRLLNENLVRDEVRASVRGAWSALTAVKTQIVAAREQISAAERALSGVREESRVGQRTTLDVLNAQQELLNARIALVVAQRDHVVASYSVLAAVGRLSAQTLGISVDQYDPDIHFDQVKGKWSGTRAADGR